MKVERAPIEEAPPESLDELVAEIGRLLAKEYVSLMQKEKIDESGDLCSVFERKPEAGEHRGPSPGL